MRHISLFRVVCLGPIAAFTVVAVWYYYTHNLMSVSNIPLKSSVTTPHSLQNDVLAKDRQHNKTSSHTLIAVGMGITFRRSLLERHKHAINELEKLPFFRSLLMSFCNTVDTNYRYGYFLAHDANDEFMQDPAFVSAFKNVFLNITENKCTLLSSYFLQFVNCSHNGKPGWAQNDAMMEAYLQGAEYFYRINDDTVMKTAGWTNIFIEALAAMDPPNVGVVGPDHIGGRTKIMTYDFTHRTHVDIFGYYYPRKFKTWHADKWITEVYKPGRSSKLHNVSLVHTMDQGKRYKSHKIAEAIVNRVIERDKETLKNFLVEKAKGSILQPLSPRNYSDCAGCWLVTHS